MLVLSFGIQKSGSTLAFELVRGVLMAAHFPQRRLPDGVVAPKHRANFVRLQEDTRAVVDGILGALRPGEIAVVKTHDVFAEEHRTYLADLIGAGRLRVQTCHRDPRDVCLSLVDAGNRARRAGRTAFNEITTLEEAANAVSRNIERLRQWRTLPNVLTLPYATVAFESHSAVRAIEAYLGVHTNVLAAIHHAFFDAFTQRNKAIKERHKRELTPEQTEALTMRFQDFLTEYAYE
jgi:hypothetical protein